MTGEGLPPMRRILCVVLLVLAGSGWSVNASAAEGVRMGQGGTLTVGGREVRCGTIRTRLDQSLPNLGVAIPEMRLLVLNPAILRRQSETVQLFVFHHECGHHHVGGSELGADCWAVGRGVRDGWLDAQGLVRVCGSFGDAPETPTHPSARRRCANLDRCFADANAEVQQGRARAAPRQVAVLSRAPKLIEAPRLLWSGRG